MNFLIALAFVILIVVAIEIPVAINRAKMAQEPGYGNNYEGIGG